MSRHVNRLAVGDSQVTMRRLRVFLCHSAGDKPAVRDLYRWLLSEGFQPWLDEEDLLPGQKWREEIPRAVLAADVVLICLSRNSLNKAGYIQREIKMALDVAEEQPDGATYLIPIRLEPCELPERLSHFHCVDLFDERGWARLLRALVVRSGELGLSPPPSFSLPTVSHTTEPEAILPPEMSLAMQTKHGAELPTNALQRYVIVPDLLQQKQTQRIARGIAYQVIAAGNHHGIVLSRGGALLIDFETMQVLWEIDCPNQCGAFNPARGLLVLGSRQHIHLWDTGRGTYLDTLRAHTGRVSTLSLSPDGKYLASGSHDETVRLWQLAGDLVITTLRGHTGPIRSSAFSPDGTILATGADNGTIRLWQGSEGINVLPGRSPIRCLAFSPDGTILAGGSGNGTIRLWSPGDGIRLDALRGHQAAVRGMAFSPDSTILATASDDKHIRIWRVIDGSMIGTLKGIGSECVSVAFTPPPPHPYASPPAPRSLVSVVNDQQQAVQIWSLASFVETTALPRTASMKATKKVEVSPSPAPPVPVRNGYMAAITALALSPDGQWLASGASDQRITLWHLPDGMPVHHLEGHTSTITSLLFSPDGQWLASGADDQTACIWHSETGNLVHRFAHHDWVRSLAFSPDSKTLAVASHDVWLWKVDDGTSFQTFKRHPDHVNSITFSPDGQTIASASWSGTVRLWQITNGERIRTLRARSDASGEHPGMLLLVAFIPDAQTLVMVSSDRVLRLWQIDQRVTTRILKGYKGKLLSAAFSPDGKTIAGASGDGVVRVWAVANGELLRSLSGHTTAVQGIAYTPDGSMLISASEDGTIRFWALL